MPYFFIHEFVKSNRLKGVPQVSKSTAKKITFGFRKLDEFWKSFFQFILFVLVKQQHDNVCHQR